MIRPCPIVQPTIRFKLMCNVCSLDFGVVGCLLIERFSKTIFYNKKALGLVLTLFGVPTI